MIQPFSPEAGSLWMLVLGGCCKRLDNPPHTCDFTANDRCSYILVPKCSCKLMLALIAAYADRGARKE